MLSGLRRTHSYVNFRQALFSLAVLWLMAFGQLLAWQHPLLPGHNGAHNCAAAVLAADAGSAAAAFCTHDTSKAHFEENVSSEASPCPLCGLLVQLACTQAPSCAAVPLPDAGQSCAAHNIFIGQACTYSETGRSPPSFC